MLGEKFGHLGLDRLRQQGTRSVAQHLGERVGKRPWLKQLDHVSIGHGVSLLCWRSGGANTPTIRRLLPVSPSPTSARNSRTSNPIESTFATVRHRTIRAKGCLSNKTALAMVFKLVDAAQKSWRRLDGHNQLLKLIQGV